MPRESRLAQNEALFREFNERIVDLETLSEGERLRLICECSTVGCESTIHVPLPEYQAVRAHPRRFLIRPGHVEPDIEDLVEKHGTYDVVEKRSDVADSL